MPAPRPLPPSQAVSVDKKIAISAQQVLPTGKGDFGVPNMNPQAYLAAAKSKATDQLNQTISNLTGGNGITVFKSQTTPYVTDETVPVSQKELNDINAKPNVLDNFANYTYHVTFSVIQESQAYTVTPNSNLNSYNRIIIAESGATVGYNITNFTLTNSVSPNFKHQNQSATEWKMTITEPYGLTFPDYVLLAAKSSQINIRNSAKFPFFIELWFTGYDENGKIVEPSVTRKVWRAMMLDFDITTNQTGTTYNLTGIVDNNIGSANQFSMPAATLNLNNVTTFGEAMERLKTALNDVSKKAENKNASATTYDIVLPNTPDMASWKIDDSLENDQRSKAMTGEGYSIPITRGQDIGNFIMSVLTKCGTSANDFLRGTTGSGSAPSIEKHGLGRIIQLFTEVELLEYDDIFNDYQKKITYRLVPFTTPRIVVDPAEAKRQSELGIQRSKLQYLIKNNLLAKKYEYIYTGKNTDVLKFDVHVENFWAITLPMFLGGRTYSQVTNGAVAANDSQYLREVKGYSSTYKAIEEVTARASNPDSIVNNPTSGELSPSSFAQIKSSFTSLSPSMASLANSAGAISQLSGQALSLISNPTNISNMSQIIQNMTKTAKTVAGSELARSIKEFTNLSILNVTPLPTFDTIISNPVQNIVSNVKSIASSAAAKVGATAASIAQQASASQGAALNRQSIYLEDIKTAVESKEPQLVSFLFDNKPQFQNSVNNGAESKNKMNSDMSIGGFSVGQSLFGTTIGNLYDQNFMVEIELEIRGDPWWIGMTNIEENEFSKTLGVVNDKANYLIGENMFYLTFKTGSNYNEQTGLMNFNANNDYFNGIYSVLEVENKFENGSFTQRLKAYKEVFSQKVNNELKKQQTQPRDAAANADVYSNKTPVSSRKAAAIATGTAEELVTDDGKAFGGGGL